MVNKVILIGNLGRDPEVKQFENNSKASFSLATNETYKDRVTGEKKTLTEWHNIVMWGRQAEIAQQFLKKGSKVYIEGKITSRKYTDSNNQERFITEIKVDSFQMLDARDSMPPMENQDYKGGASKPDFSPENQDDDLPF
jgi:single-strand DNA-binding protein